MTGDQGAAIGSRPRSGNRSSAKGARFQPSWVEARSCWRATAAEPNEPPHASTAPARRATARRGRWWGGAGRAMMRPRPAPSSGEGGEADVSDQAQESPGAQGRRGLAAVCRRGYAGRQAPLQRVRMRPRGPWRRQVQPRQSQAELESSDEKRRSLKGLLPFLGCRAASPPRHLSQHLETLGNPAPGSPAPRRSGPQGDFGILLASFKGACYTPGCGIVSPLDGVTGKRIEIFPWIACSERMW